MMNIKRYLCLFSVVSAGAILSALAFAGEGNAGSQEREVPVSVITPAASFTPINAVQRGQRVTLRGEVVRLKDEDEFVLADETGRIDIYIGWRNDMPVKVGETVTVVGMADDDAVPGQRPEIYARTLILANEDIVDLRTGRLISREDAARAAMQAESTSAEPATEAERRTQARADRPIVPINEVRRGQRVRVSGEVSRIRDSDEFILRDETGRIRVYIGWRNDMVVEVGDSVTVYGVADDDVLPFMRPEIYARTITFQDGKVVNLSMGRASRYPE